MGHGGLLVVDGVQHELLPGWLAALSASWRLLDGREAKPFVVLTGTFGAAGASTREIGREETEGYTAFDLRVGLAVGKTLFDTLSPYIGARVFGGPILWRFRGEDLSGTDKHHYQLALGVTAALPGNFDVFAEGVPLGERGVTVGAGAAF